MNHKLKKWNKMISVLVIVILSLNVNTYVNVKASSIEDYELDTDLDGLPDYYEGFIGTNKQLSDTDGDGLTDYDEYYRFSLNPLSDDTDGDKIKDGDEDDDKDGLTVMIEISLGTHPCFADTDLDGINDGDEVNKYHTNPLECDSDEDGIEDGDELQLGLNPLRVDSDGNGLTDYDEKKEITMQLKIEEEEIPQVTKVSLKINGTGNIKSDTRIRNMYNIDMLSSSVVGMRSVPIEIESSSSFDKVTITFYYDDSKLGNTKEEDLAVMWYDETNKWYEVFHNSKVDTAKNTVSVTTTHLSTFLVVDCKAWYDFWENSIVYYNPDGSLTDEYSYIESLIALKSNVNDKCIQFQISFMIYLKLWIIKND